MKTEETVFGPTKIFTNNYSNTPPSTKSRKNIADELKGVKEELKER